MEHPHPLQIKQETLKIIFVMDKKVDICDKWLNVKRQIVKWIYMELAEVYSPGDELFDSIENFEKLKM
jgi:hypothetical protein